MQDPCGGPYLARTLSALLTLLFSLYEAGVGWEVPQSGVNAVDRAVEILRVLGAAPTSLTLAEISELSDVPRSTVHRIVKSLIDVNFIVVDRRKGGLRLGPEFARLASVSGVRLVTLVRPHLHKLSQKVGEGASLVVLEGSQIRFLDQVIAINGMRAVSRVGSTMPAHTTANGKALLAELPDRTVLATVSRRLESLTENTIVDRGELIAELAGIRNAGFAFDREENQIGICAVACVVHDAVGTAAAINIALAADHFYGREDELAEAVVETARELDATLAHATD